MGRWIAFGMLAVAGAAPAIAATTARLDLVCHGRSTVTAQGIAPIVKPVDSAMSIDGRRRLWCWHKGAGCLEVLAIRAIDGKRIVLRNENGPQGTARMILDLKTGVYRSRMHITASGTAPIDAVEVGRCRPKPSWRPVDRRTSN